MTPITDKIKMLPDGDPDLPEGWGGGFRDYYAKLLSEKMALESKLESLVSKAIQPAIRELLCQRCDSEYPVWYAPNELWNQVQRDGEHFFCPTCFAVLAEERGIETTAWRLTLETEENREAQHNLHMARLENARLVSELETAKRALEAAEVKIKELNEIAMDLSAELGSP